MNVRYYSPADFAAVKEIHAAQGLAYTLPDLEQPEFLVRTVIERDDGSVAAGLFLRKTAEAYLLMSPNHDSRREKIKELMILHKELAPIAQRVGLSDIHCVLPPELEARFGKLLMHFGWVKTPWQMFERKVG